MLHHLTATATAAALALAAVPASALQPVGEQRAISAAVESATQRLDAAADSQAAADQRRAERAALTAEVERLTAEVERLRRELDRAEQPPAVAAVLADWHSAAEARAAGRARALGDGHESRRGDYLHTVPDGLTLLPRYSAPDAAGVTLTWERSSERVEFTNSAGETVAQTTTSVAWILTHADGEHARTVVAGTPMVQTVQMVAPSQHPVDRSD